MVLHEHAVVQNRNVGWSCDTAARRKTRSAIENVVALPLAGLAARVHKRDVLFVKARRLSVRIRDVVVRVEHLDLVAALQEHAAVAAALAFAFDLGRRAPFDMKLAIAETPPGLDVAGALDDSEGSVGDRPFRGRAVLLL